MPDRREPVGERAAACAAADDDHVVVVAHRLLLQTRAIGEVQAPVAPRSLGWVRTSANSRTPSAASSRGVEVLDDEDAVDGVQPLRHLERPGRVLGRHGAVAPGVAAGERDAVLDEPVGELVARAGLAVEVCVGIVPVRAPAGVEEHGVARLGFDAGRCRRR